MTLSKQSKGFSLIELMIVVAIIALIAAIAIPSYNSYVTRSMRADGMGGLMNAASAMERFRAVNMTYVGADTNLPFNQNVPNDGGTPYYTITVGGITRTTYTLTATPVNAMAGREGVLTINQAGQKTWVDSSGSTNNCWPEGGATC